MKVTISNRQRLLRVNSPLLRQVARAALRELHAIHDRVSVVVVGDKEMARLNETFHHTSGPTDVLTFGYNEGDPTGEIVVSADRAVANARRYRVTPGRELALYVVHGILHLHGHNDLEIAARARMRRAERAVLRRLDGHHDLDALAGSSPFASVSPVRHRAAVDRGQAHD
jgi:probable rRNA maturation factor